VERNSDIDAIRFVGFCAIALLHTVTTNQPAVTANALIDHATRWAVPVFFMLSGYLLEAGRRSGWEKWKRAAVRLAIIFVSWEVIYYGVRAVVLGPDPMPSIPGLLLSGGVAWHLWFLPSLGLCLTIFLLLRPFGWSLLIAVAGLFFVLGLVLGPYAPLTGASRLIEMLGKSDGVIGTRSGPFFGLIFVVLGAHIAVRPADEGHRALWWGVALGGLALQIVEAQVLVSAAGARFAAYDYLFGTLIFGLGAFMALRRLSYHPLLAHLGRLALGMYCCHVLVRDLLGLAIGQPDPATLGIVDVLFRWLLLVALAIVVTLALDRLPLTRRIVR
jgi:surface polysaccharide O-acyltransferase-like enzyme